MDVEIPIIIMDVQHRLGVLHNLVEILILDPNKVDVEPLEDHTVLQQRVVHILDLEVTMVVPIVDNDLIKDKAPTQDREIM